MTKKRFLKLTRAYFTRLNEWAKETGNKTLNMGNLYRNLPNLNDNLGVCTTRDEWWRMVAGNTNSFGVGVKGGKS